MTTCELAEFAAADYRVLGDDQGDDLAEVLTWIDEHHIDP